MTQWCNNLARWLTNQGFRVGSRARTEAIHCAGTIGMFPWSWVYVHVFYFFMVDADRRACRSSDSQYNHKCLL